MGQIKCSNAYAYKLISMVDGLEVWLLEVQYTRVENAFISVNHEGMHACCVAIKSKFQTAYLLFWTNWCSTGVTKCSDTYAYKLISTVDSLKYWLLEVQYTRVESTFRRLFLGHSNPLRAITVLQVCCRNSCGRMPYWDTGWLRTFLLLFVTVSQTSLVFRHTSMITGFSRRSGWNLSKKIMWRKDLNGSEFPQNFQSFPTSCLKVINTIPPAALRASMAARHHA